MNTPVSFPIAKLLKAKGYNNPELNFFFEDGESKENVLRETTGMDYGSEFTVEFSELIENWNDAWLTKKNGDRCFGCSKTKGYLETYSAPFISTVVMWLYEKHGIWVRVEPDWDGDFWAQIKSREIPDARIGKWQVVTALAPYKSPTEAYEAGIVYALNNLI